MSKIFFWVLFPFFFNTLMAANPGTLKGRIVNAADDTGLPYVHVVITTEENNETLTGAITDESGFFEIEDIPIGTFLLKISTLGYDAYTSTITFSKDRTSINIGTIPMQENVQMLDGVTIVGQTPQMSFKTDKREFNVSQSLSSAGGTAMDVLADIPSVTVDPGGEISFRGNNQVMIWINGQASGLSAEYRDRILSQIPSQNIEKVEIITNPSAKYNAEGTAGIINIITKKNNDVGDYGRVQTGADTRGGYHMNTTYYHNTEKWKTEISLSHRRQRNLLEGYTYRTNIDPVNEQQYHLNMDSRGTETTTPFTGSIGLTYQLTPKMEIGIQALGMLETERLSNTLDYVSDIPDDFLSRTRNVYEEDYMRVGNLRLNYNYVISERSHLDVIVSRNAIDFESFGDFNQESVFPSGESTQHYQHQDQNVNVITWEMQTDYTIELGESAKLEAGYKADLLDREGFVETSSGPSQDDAESDPDLFNTYNFMQNVHAWYGTYSNSYGKLNYQLGVRAELTSTEVQSFGYGQNENNTPTYTTGFLDLFPSAYISYELDNDELQLNYSRRISRPTRIVLDPSPDISDPTYITVGNPYLNPEYADVIELNYLNNGKHTFSTSLYYRRVNNAIQQVNYLQNDIIVGTYENLGNRVAAGVELIETGDFFNFLTLTASANLFYNHLDGYIYTIPETTRQVVEESQGDFAWNGRLSISKTLPLGIKIQLTGNYNSRIISSQGEEQANGSFDMGVRKAFYNNKLNLVLFSRNILDTRKTVRNTSGTGFYQESMHMYGGRVFGLSLTYNFEKNGTNPNDDSLDEFFEYEED
ncbi:outer membrane beta-barrel protein [Sinomicrobium kalidii]|uniref:outer membrane beta-barrel protein n=1 Tax=Sinomicrobium kalidii TaxID=2900738 RepID=UPI001E64709E|nr:outer membrane beta-barrel protein [Sinomicrobium kalidii]UGU15464.1 outer membrane beta-barrel protein [Sinomicrobium kalidii]